MLIKAFYFVTGLGGEAVIVFFVISGFLVGGGAAKKFLQGRYDAKDYAIHRVSRIYTVLIPALLVGYALDSIGLAYFNQSTIYTSHAAYPTLPLYEVVSHSLTIKALMGNLLMLQNWFVPILGSNGPLWSLALEWWYYCIFWAILGFASTHNSMLVKSAYGVFALLLLFLLPMKTVLWFLIWLMGVALAWSGTLKYRVNPILALVLFVGILIVVRLSNSLQNLSGSEPLYLVFMKDLAVAIGCFVLLASLSHIRRFPLGTENFHRMMANFSYTIYLVHFPFMVFFVAFAFDVLGLHFVQQPTLASGAYFVILLGVIYLYGYFFAKYTENNTAKVRTILWGLTGIRFRFT
jgi:peptidoglycan/LPS O-acetylase OafA/YrhL